MLSCSDFKQSMHVENVPHVRGYQVQQIVDSRGQGPSTKCKAKVNINTVPIKGRVVYNSALNKKQWEGLISRGNKNRVLYDTVCQKSVYSRLY